MSDETAAPTKDGVRALVREALAAALRVDAASIGPDEPLQELPGADSVRLLKAIAELERRLGVEFEDEEIFRPQTLEGLVNLAWNRVDENA